MEQAKDVSIGVVLLSAGSGSRMNSEVPKQYLDVCGKPVLYYSLKCFDMHEAVRDIVIVAAPEYHEMIRTEIVEKYNIQKVHTIVNGGKERYNSVYNGIKELGSNDYVMIHDGARPCINNELLDRIITEVKLTDAVVPAVPSKDTVRIADKDGYIKETPERSSVWNMQTPQTFELSGLVDAFDKYMNDKNTVQVTDDAMIWEMYDNRRIKLVMGDYSNIKLTTPEDMLIIYNNIKNRA